MKKRKTDYRRYNWLYKRFGNNWTNCIYCGELSIAFDHVPPISKVENLNIEEFKNDGFQFLLYPSCRECNQILNDKMIIDLYDRMIFLFDRYTEKAKKLDQLWDQNEINELGPNLKSLVLMNYQTFLFYQDMANRVQNQIAERFFKPEND